MRVKIKLLTKREIEAPNALLPKSAFFTRFESKLSKNEASVSIATKIKIPPKTSDNSKSELSQLLIYAPI